MVCVCHSLLRPAQLLPQILSTFNTMALEVCEGQQYDMDFERKPKVSVVEYMHMIELKTSVLLAGATTIGALLGGASEEDCRKLRRFAIELGLAFQLQDDLLDSYGDERLGKAIGGDILEGKQTYLMITAISRADEPTREVLRSTHRSQMPDAEKIATIKAVYDRLDIPRLTEQQISLRFERALGILDTLSVEKSRTERMREYALMPGTAVVHRAFGPGMVVSRSGAVAVIAFDEVGTKKVELTACLRKRLLRLASAPDF